MKIGVASDHAGYEYKNRLAELLTKKGYDVATTALTRKSAATSPTLHIHLEKLFKKAR